MLVRIVWLGGVAWLMRIAETVAVRFAAHVESCDSRALLTAFRWSLGQHVTTRSVRTFVLRAVLKDQRCTLWGYSVEFLLLCNEMHLWLLLHLVVHLTRC